jgi:hypothetical protein
MHGYTRLVSAAKVPMPCLSTSSVAQLEGSVLVRNQHISRLGIKPAGNEDAQQLNACDLQVVSRAKIDRPSSSRFLLALDQYNVRCNALS